MVTNPNNGYYYTPEEWSRLGMMGPLPDERNSLLQRNNMKITEVAEPSMRPVEGIESILRYGDDGKVYNVNSQCWKAEYKGQDGFLCDRREREGGEYSRSGRGKEDGPVEFVFVSKETGQKAKGSWPTVNDAKSEVTLQFWPE